METDRTPMLEIVDLHVRAGDRQILKGLSITIGSGEVHAIMGPNGSGKSTLAQVLAGRDGYDITHGQVTFLGQDILDLAPEERAQAGIFLAFQYPIEIPGVNNAYLLKAALNAQRKARGEPGARRIRVHAPDQRQHGADADPQGLLIAECQHGILGWREEA